MIITPGAVAVKHHITAQPQSCSSPSSAGATASPPPSDAQQQHHLAQDHAFFSVRHRRSTGSSSCIPFWTSSPRHPRRAPAPAASLASGYCPCTPSPKPPRFSSVVFTMLQPLSPRVVATTPWRPMRPSALH